MIYTFKGAYKSQVSVLVAKSSEAEMQGIVA